MKLIELINEVRIYRNNFVKVMRAQTAIDTLYPKEETIDRPTIKNDSEGIYITIDTIQMSSYIKNGLGSFLLRDDKFVDDYKNIRKYYIEYNKSIEAPKTNTNSTEKKRSLN